MKTIYRAPMLALQFLVLALAACVDTFARRVWCFYEGPPSDLKALHEATEKALGKIADLVKEQAEKALAEAAKGVAMSTEAKTKTDELLLKYNELNAVITDIARKQSALPTGPERQKTYGEQLVESEGYKALMAKGGRGTIALEVKTITSANAGGLIRPLYETEPVPLPKRRLVVRDLLTVVPITTSSVDYPKQTTRTNAAAVVSETVAKPYSSYVWSNATAAVRTIAHLAKLTRQAMDDAPRLTAEVDAEMRYGLGLVEEAQLLSGSGAGQNLNGIITQATAFAAPITVATPTRVDNLRLAMLQVALALYSADGIVLNEGDWAAIELLKDSTNRYLFSNPQGGATVPRLWGLPVVATPAMALDAFLVGNFTFGATLYNRMGVELLISTENVNDFEKNLATMRCEERIALAVKRPASFVVGDFGIVT